MPCLYDGEHQIVQSAAIMRHLGRKHGLYGNTELEATFVDMMADGVEDLRKKYLNLIYNGYSEEGKTKLANEFLPGHMAAVDKV